MTRPRPGPATPPAPADAGTDVDPDPPLPTAAVVLGLIGIAVIAAIGAWVCVLLTPFRIGTALVPVAVVLAVALNGLLPGLAWSLARSRGAAALPVIVFAVVAWSPSVAPGGDVLLPGGGAWQTAISFGVLLLGLVAGIVAALRAR